MEVSEIRLKLAPLVAQQLIEQPLHILLLACRILLGLLAQPVCRRRVLGEHRHAGPHHLRLCLQGGQSGLAGFRIRRVRFESFQSVAQGAQLILLRDAHELQLARLKSRTAQLGL